MADKDPPTAKEPESNQPDDNDEDGEIHESEQTSSDRPVASSDDNAPPLPDEEPPPLPDEPTPEDDGWEPGWDADKQAWYFYNRFTGKSQWENPRVPTAAAASSSAAPAPTSSSAPGLASDGTASSSTAKTTGAAGGYNPAIHGDYDPNADYALADKDPADDVDYDNPAITDPSQMYAQAGSFNRFTGKWQAGEAGPEKHSDAEKARRQMRAIFDVDAAANSHDGRSLKEERRNRKLTKEQVKAFNDKRRAKKEEKRRAWLKD